MCNLKVDNTKLPDAYIAPLCLHFLYAIARVVHKNWASAVIPIILEKYWLHGFIYSNPGYILD